jgi:23S rRNA pseudouridine955/2504/2580 synthase
MKGITVLFEDDEILILDKPSGLAVQGGAGVGVSLDALLAAERNPAPLLVHRLDKDTSGVILTAKTKAAAGKYSALLRSGALEKRYLALCAGRTPEKGLIQGELEMRGKRKTAETRYWRLDEGKLPRESAANRDYAVSFLEISLATGRMHQIRRHLAGAGFPLLGDDKYGDFSLNKILRKSGLKKLLLHASSITLKLSKGSFTVNAPLPEHFLRFLEYCECKKKTMRLDVGS